MFPVFVLSFMAVLGLSLPAHAQQQAATVTSVNQSKPTPPPQVAPQEPTQSASSAPSMNDEEVTILRDDFAGKYNPSTIDKLAQLYWRLGAFDLDDNEAITNYIKITDCKIYTDYVNDDLEWKEIVNVMRESLRRKRDTFDLNFQFVLPVHLGRYDPTLKGFPIVDRTGFVDAKRIEVDSMDRDKDVCHDSNAVKDYPKSLIILLPHSFTLDFLNLDEHVAQAYILRKKAEYSQLDESLKVSRYEREAYLRLRVSFSQYHGNLRGEQSTIMGILFGNIDGYEIFEDSQQKRLMASVDLKKQAAANNTVPAPQMSLPADERPAPAQQQPAVTPPQAQAPQATTPAAPPTTAPATSAPIQQAPQPLPQ